MQVNASSRFNMLGINAKATYTLHVEWNIKANCAGTASLVFDINGMIWSFINYYWRSLNSNCEEETKGSSSQKKEQS